MGRRSGNSGGVIQEIRLRVIDFLVLCPKNPLRRVVGLLGHDAKNSTTCSPFLAICLGDIVPKVRLRVVDLLAICPKESHCAA